MIVKAIHPEVEGNVKTSLTQKAAAAQAVLVVQNPVGLAVDNYVVIGNPGQELTEIRKIASISGKNVTLSAVLSNTHESNAPVQFIKYNQIRFYKASSIAGVYSVVSTKDIAIDEPWTLYEDVTAVSSDYFKIKYYNSTIPEESVFSDPISAAGFTKYSLAQIIEDLYRRSGDTKKQFLIREEIIEWVNEIKDDMVNQIIDSVESYFNKDEDIQVDSTGKGTLPDNFRKFNKVSVFYDGVNEKPATKMRYDQLEMNQTYNQEYPKYAFDSYSIHIRPTGTPGTTIIRVKNESQPVDLENDSDELPKPLRFYMKTFKDGLMARAAEKAGKDTRSDRYWKKYTAGVEQMLEEINNLVLNENGGVEDNEDDEGETW